MATIRSNVLSGSLTVSGSAFYSGDITSQGSVSASIFTGTNITSSGVVSASYFYGDGSNLTGITATASPAGSNTEIQFNNNGITGASSDLAWDGSALNIVGGLSASVNISASSFYGDGSNLTGILTTTELSQDTSPQLAGTLDVNGFAISGSVVQISGSSIRNRIQEDSTGFVIDGPTGNLFSVKRTTGNHVNMNIGTMAFSLSDNDITADLATAGKFFKVINSSNGDIFSVSEAGLIQVTGSLEITQNITSSGTVTASEFHGSGANLTSLTASNITNFQDDVREQISAGTGISFTSGEIAASNVPNSSLQNSTLNVGTTSIALGATGSTIQGLTALSSSVVSASTFYGDGSNLTGVSAIPGGSDTYVQFNDGGSFGGSANLTWDDTNFNITGALNVDGVVTAKEFHTQVVSSSIVYQSGSTKFGDTSDDTHEFTGSILVAGTLSASSGLTAASFTGDGSNLTNLTASNVTNFSSDVRKQLSAGSGVSYDSSTGVISAGSNISTTTVSASVGVSGAAIQAGTFTGDGSSLTNLTASNITNFTTDVRNQFSAGTGIGISSGQISTSNVPNSSLQYSTFNLGTTSIALGATGSTIQGITELTASTITASYVSASFFYGDGSLLENIPTSSYYRHTSSATPPSSPAPGFWWYDNSNNILYNMVSDSNGTSAWIDVSTALSALTLKDADNDTKIQVEESGDEDKIRFDTSGSERMIIDNVGRVGIGTSAPDHTLSVIGNISSSVNISASAFYGDGSNLTGVSVSPGGSDTYIQFNDGGSFGGSSNLTWDDTSLSITGDLTASANVSASAFYGDGSNLTGISITTELSEDTTPQLGGNLDLNSSNITGTGDISITGDITASGTVSGSTLNATTATFGSTTVTNLTASGTVSASILYGDGSNLTGVGGTPGGSNTNIQFNNAGAFSGSGDLTWDGSSLSITGDLTASANVSASFFYGDGSLLSNLPTGSLYKHTSSANPPSSPAPGNWWYDNSNNILYNLVTDSSGTSAWIDVSTALSALTLKDADNDTKIQVEESGDEDKIRFDTSGSERMIIDNVGRVGVGTSTPDHTLSVIGNISSSVNISASAFYGDGSNLTGIAASPGGSDNHIQFNNGGSFAGSSNLTWDDTSLTITGDLTASANVSASAFYGDGSNLTGISTTTELSQDTSPQLGGNLDLNSNNITGTGDISVTGNLTSSGTVSASIFYGDGSNLTGVGGTPGGSDNQIQFNDGGSFGGSSNLTWDDTSLTITGDLTASANVSASAFYGDGSNLTGISITTELSEDTSPQLGGTLDLNGQAISGSSVQISGSVSINDSATLTNLTASGTVSASVFYGDGSNLSGVAVGAYYHTVSSSAPSNPQTGSWWYDTVNNILYNRIKDENNTEAWIDVSTATSTLVIKDADSDTKIQVEESADEDKIRFDTSGSERMIIDNSGLVGIGTSSPDHTLTVVGNVSASVNISASSYYGDGSNLTGLSYLSNVSEDTTPQLGGNLDLNSNNITGTGDISVTGNLTASGTVSGSILYGNGASITNLTASNIDNFTTDVRGQFTAGTGIGISGGTISTSGVLSNLSEDTTPQLGGNLDLNGSDITGTGDISVTGNLTSSGTVSASIFYGDGSNLTGLASANSITDLAQDTTPQLGGNLDLNSNNITGTGNIYATGSLQVNITDNTGEVYKVSQGSNVYHKIDTTNSSERHNLSHGNGVYQILLSPSQTLLRSPNNQGDINLTDGGFAYSLYSATSTFDVTDSSDNNILRIKDSGVQITGSLRVDGIVTAKEFHTQVVSSSIVYQSGSTKFGDDSGDTHQITGSVYHTGSNFQLTDTNTLFRVGSTNTSTAYAIHQGNASKQNYFAGRIIANAHIESNYINSIGNGWTWLQGGTGTVIFKSQTGDAKVEAQSGTVILTGSSGIQATGSVKIYTPTSGDIFKIEDTSGNAYVSITGSGIANYGCSGNAKLTLLSNNLYLNANGGAAYSNNWFRALKGLEVETDTKSFTVINSSTTQIMEIDDSSVVHITGSVKITGSLEVAGDDPSSSAIFTTVKKTVNSPGSHLYTVATASYDGLFVDYTVASGSNMRAGQITAMHNSSEVNHTETSTIDFGDTSGFNFDVVISGENMALSASANSDGWSVKAIIRGI